jgi:selenocysteine lyase/cysteine desulfurase
VTANKEGTVAYTTSALSRELRAQMVGLDVHVPLLDGSTRPAINFDNAASTPALRPVLETINHFMSWYSSVHRGTGFKSRVATQAYEDARAVVGRFLGARDDQHVVIFGKNSTEAINKLARRIPFCPGQVVLCSLIEHHSNDLPWRGVAEVVHIEVDARGRLDEDHFAALLRQYAGRVRLVAISGGSNVTGAIAPVHRLAEQAHAAGAEIFVDCAQLAPHRKVDIGALDDPAHLDYVAISGHKMYAPFGSGALVGRRDTFAEGAPEYVGGGTVDTVTVDAVVWSAPPDRDEAGSPNVVGVVALAAGLEALDQIGMEAIAAHEAELTAHALSRLAQVPRLRLYGDGDPAHAAGRLGVIPFELEGISHILVASVLNAEFGIAVRNGSFCAQPYLARLLGLSEADVARAHAELRAGDRRHLPGLVRASFGMYNTVEEVDALAEALGTIARGEYQGEYIQDQASGDYRPRGWEPDLECYFALRAGARNGASC